MIYLDNSATTKVDDIAIEKMVKTMKVDYGNPSALYDFGLSAEKLINTARKEIANVLEVSNKEIYFTSSGTEGNNIAIVGSFTNDLKEEFLTTEIEHSSVYNVYRDSKKNIIYLKVNKHGYVDLKDLEKNINENTRLVSIMQVNNEIGSVQNIEEIGNIIKRKNPKTLFHVDGIQGFGKYPININKSKIDMYTISGHKIHGPKGIGAIFIKNGINLKPLIIGGGQESGISPGTENVPGIVALGTMAKIANENFDKNFENSLELKKYLINKLKNTEDLIINSSIENSSPYILSVSIKDIRAEVLLHFLEMERIYISTGSACSKGKISRVVGILNLPKGYEDGTIRISFSKYTTKEELDIFYESLIKYTKEIRSITRRN